MDVLIEERREVVAGLRQSVRDSGLSQARFARLLGTSGPRMSAYLAGTTNPSAALYLRATKLGSSLRRMRELGLMAPDQTVAAVNRALDEKDEDFALRMVLQARDDIRREADEPSVRTAWAQRSLRIADERFDVLFRALAGREFGDSRPSWTLAEPLPQEWVIADPFRDDESTRAQTPPWLARLGIYIAERGLVTV
ncbi:MAG TPA: helix-turn-helix transcriptional regulator [Candidatus Luteococcus avicola]|nr:helix-turn-helix transcriptional regulator [Candidatus Luteococcus avicola]